MSDDLRTRLDDAIIAARREIWRLINVRTFAETSEHYDDSNRCLTLAFNDYGDLRELRARWEVIDRRGCERRAKTGTCIDKGHQSLCPMCRYGAELAADVRRLLEKDSDDSV